MGTIIVSALLVLAIGSVIAAMVRRKKQGKTTCSCGGSCSECKCCHH